MIFSKPPRTPEYLAHKLISNGLQEVSEKELTDLFQSINYYKLRGYTYPYQDNSVPDSPVCVKAVFDVGFGARCGLQVQLQEPLLQR